MRPRRQLPTRPAGVSGSTLRELTGLADRADAWDAVLDRSALPGPFLRSWWIDGLADERSCVLLVEREGRLLGGLALERLRGLPGVERFRALGGGPLCADHVDLVAAPEDRDEVVAALRAWFRSGSRLLDLRGVRAGADLVAVLAPARVVADDVAPYEPIPDLAGYQTARSGGFGRRMRRRERQVERRGVTVRTVDEGELPRVLGRLAELHRALPGREALAAEVPKLLGPLSAATRRGEAITYVAEHEGRCGAVLVAFRSHGRLSLYQGVRSAESVFDDVGTVLDHRAICEAAEAGLTEVDLLRGDESYKELFTSHRRTLLRVQAAHGPVARTVLAVELLARAVRGRLRREPRPTG